MKPIEEIDEPRGQEGGLAPALTGHPLAKGVRRLLSGRLGIGQTTREAFRRGQAAVRSRRERARLDELGGRPARLTSEFQKLSPAELLNHFRNRTAPKFFPGFETENVWSLSTGNVPSSFLLMLTLPARPIIEHRWELLGFGEKDFGQTINWHRDPLSGRIWPLDYHTDIPLWHNDGSDIRALWELNRLSHLVTLGRAYVVIRANGLAWKEFGEIIRADGLEWNECVPGWVPDVDEEFFLQVESWYEQNPLGRGANWACAMEVALRSMNLLTAFTLFKSSSRLNEERLLLLLKMFDQHGSHIRRNLEFSHVTTSNHYLSDVAGLLWLGIMLPELQAAGEWRDWALAELLSEMDKQILDDGADYEAATAYHRFVLELFLYSFLLCRANEISIADKYWLKLRAMLAYLRGILRPNRTLPLIGDNDDGTVLPVSGTDHELSLLAIGAAVFQEPQFKLSKFPESSELVWVLGETGLRDFDALESANEELTSQAFPYAGEYVLHHHDLTLLFNAGNPQKGSPTSHRHNDALSVEVSVGSSVFIVDPGSYVYTANLHERHLFRSTAYHSTIQIDNEEQQTIRDQEPFKNGTEARVRVLLWETTAARDRIVAEHAGYERLPQSVTHRRAVTFDKTNRWWLIEDELGGRGNHSIAARFHFDAGLDVSRVDERSVIAKDLTSGAQLVVSALSTVELRFKLEPQFVSRSYGSKLPSTTACWSLQTSVPCKLSWALVPVSADEDVNKRLALVQSLKSNVESATLGIGQAV